MPKTVADAPKTLPRHAREIWAAAFNSAYDGTCKGEGERRSECAARVAMAAVKREYKQLESGKWVKKAATQTDFNELELGDLEATYLADFIVAKTSSLEGELRWMGRASDTFEDSLGTRMTKTLFMNFIRRAESYGEPYLGIAHYGSLGGAGVAGPTTDMWIDGSMFKAKGTFNQNSLGLALYGALNTERSAQGLDPESRIRLSLGFLDLKHTHGAFVFERRSLYDECPFCGAADLPDTFLDGVLVHFAATRVPLNERSTLEIDDGIGVQRSDAQGVTRFEDAASIVGESLASQLEILRLESAGDPDVELSETVVEMSASQPEVEESPAQIHIEEEITMPDELNVQLVEEPTEETNVETELEAAPRVEPGVEDQEPTPAPAASEVPLMAATMEPVQSAIATFSQAVLETLQTPGLSRDERLQQLQPALEEMSAAVVMGAETASDDPQAQLVTAFRSALRDEMGPVVQGLQQVVMALSVGAQPTTGRRTHSHGLPVPTVPTSEEKRPSQFKTIARRSVGLDQDQG